MILNDRAIMRYIADGKIEFTPDIFGNQIQPASVDLRLGGSRKKVDSDLDCDFEDNMVLTPGEVYITHTMEEISLPNDIAGLITGRSTLGRMGILTHITAGWIDPGFSGQITLEMVNLGHQPKELEPGQRIVQIVFFKTIGESRGYDGQYQDQVGVEEAGEL